MLGIALVAGGAAAFLVSSGDESKVDAPAPVAQLATVDVLIAKGDINMGAAVGAQDFQWQAWPAATTGGSSYVLKKDRPNAVEELSGSIARRSSETASARSAKVGTGFASDRALTF